jgi:hypothetical protein
LDLQGRAVRFLQSVKNDECIDVSDLSAGVYILRLGNRTAKFVKQ